MNSAKKGQLVGGLIGMAIGAVVAYMLWDFKSPGGLLILIGYCIGGLTGYSLGGGGKKTK